MGFGPDPHPAARMALLKVHVSNRSGIDSGARVSRLEFFVRLPPFGNGAGIQRAWLTLAETELAEHALALAYADLNPVSPREPNPEGLPVPRRLPRAGLAGRALQHSLHLPDLSLAQAPGPSAPSRFGQSSQTALFKMSNPVLHRARGNPQQAADLRAGHPLSDQQYCMQALIIARFPGTTNLFLERPNLGDRISKGQ
jgi:hypothetical protein